MSSSSSCSRVAIIGGGPSGLMAAEVLSRSGVTVTVYDAMPSVGRKFLLAGVGGMNITHSEAKADFLGRYRERENEVAAWLQDFDADKLREWVHGLGVETFVGSSGKVFPREMKAAPLLRAWLTRLREAGVQFRVRHRWLGWSAQGALRFATPDGELEAGHDAVLLALGGGSWKKLGSDGSWLPLLAERGVAVRDLLPANCGFDCNWSSHFADKFAGQPLKSVLLEFTDLAGHTVRKTGECVVTRHGVEGNLIYAFSAPIRDSLLANGSATVYLDLLPQKSAEQVAAEVKHPRGSRSLSSHLQSRLNLKGVRAGLLRECLSKEAFNDMQQLAAGIKRLPLTMYATRPIDEAISTAGGVRLEALDPGLMLKDMPGVFCAGEMLDWEAPTGGYLLTACLASGRAAGQGMLDWLAARGR
ncbi:TIGR03862 family flavoprotein [Aquitalea sp. LB_tupeE]|uniref:TIGR03862 family flavoprotein n=1 Tax=Aquitalea sp. LB_tupeE TaxID=2748078 RepID=UPI0015BB324C|nr:TIGR03862 family flavoprotein [Aquitalea sp. LB_tupeE]NWK79371.1 TIGR03862 family flavoprotein [Aquitalea sp. LB_tupeE]